jgi:uncharacterized protein (DUF2267 family)
MQYDEFITRVNESGGIADRGHAETAIAATLEVLGQRLSGGEASDLAAQLPTELKGLLDAQQGDAEGFGVDEFLRRVAEREARGCGPDQAREHARAVLSTLSEAASGGELADLKSQLPAGYELLMR